MIHIMSLIKHKIYCTSFSNNFIKCFQLKKNINENLLLIIKININFLNKTALIIYQNYIFYLKKKINLYNLIIAYNNIN